MTNVNVSWMSEGLCRTSANVRKSDANWYAEIGTTECLLAVRICKQCPVSETCLQFALENEEEFGVWGGFAAGQRDGLLRGMSREQVQAIRRTYSRRSRRY